MFKVELIYLKTQKFSIMISHSVGIFILQRKDYGCYHAHMVSAVHHTKLIYRPNGQHHCHGHTQLSERNTNLRGSNKCFKQILF